MVTNFNPRNLNINNIIRDNWNIIDNTEELQKIFPDKPLIGFRRLPNLSDLLTSNKITYSPKLPTNTKNTSPPVCTRLGKCTYCPKLHKEYSFISSHTHKKEHLYKNLPPKPRLKCELYNVIYLIHCMKCQKQYIGETGRPIKNRIYEHIASVKNNKKTLITPVSKHFTSEGHTHKHMRFSVIDSTMVGKSHRTRIYEQAQKT